MANVYNRRIIKDKQKLHEQKVLEQHKEIGFRSAHEKKGRIKAAIKRSKRNSAISFNSLMDLITYKICSLYRLFKPIIPDPPDIKPILSGPGVIISVICFPLYIKSERLYCGIAPNITSTFARPKSASKIITLFPILLS